MSFRLRVVVLVAAAVAAAIVAASALVYVVMRNELNGQLDDRLRTQASRAFFVARRGADGRTRITVLGVNRAPVQPGLSLSQGRAARPVEPAPVEPGTGGRAQAQRTHRIVVPGPLGSSSAIAQLLTGEGDVLGPSGDTPLLPTTARTRAVAAGKVNAFYSDATVNGVAVRMFTVATPEGAALTVAEPRADVDSTLRRLLVILIGVSGAGVALAAGLGVLVSRRVLVPVVRLTGATEHVAATQDLEPADRGRRRRRAGADGGELQHDAGSARRRPRARSASSSPTPRTSCARR